MEAEIVHGGEQSMPVYYDNCCAPYYSKAERIFRTPRYWYGDLTPQDWTIDGADALTLYFHGDPDNAPDPLYVAIVDSARHIARVTHPDADAALVTEWRKWQIALADLQAAGVNIALVKKVTIGIGDRDNPQPGGTALIYIDDIWTTKRMP